MYKSFTLVFFLCFVFPKLNGATKITTLRSGDFDASDASVLKQQVSDLRPRNDGGK